MERIKSTTCNATLVFAEPKDAKAAMRKFLLDILHARRESSLQCNKRQIANKL